MSPVITTDDLDKHFWWRLAGVSALVGIGAFVILILTWKALVAWGLLGLFLFLAALALGASWINDKRHPRID